MRLGGLLFAITLSCFAQAPQNWGAAGGGICNGQPCGIAAFATLISAKGPVYSFSEYQLTSFKSHPFSLQTTTSTGFCTTGKEMDLGKFHLTIMACATAGVSVATVSNNSSPVPGSTPSATAGFAATGGGIGILSADKLWPKLKGWNLSVVAQQMKTTVGAGPTAFIVIGKGF